MPFLLFAQQQELAFSIHNEGHAAPVNQLLISKKTNEIISVSEDKSIGFWDLTNFQLKKIQHLNGGYYKKGIFYDACFFNDSNYIAIVGNNISSVDSINYIHLLNIKDKSIKNIATKSKTILHCSSSFDEKTLYLADDQNHLETLVISSNNELVHQKIDSFDYQINAITATEIGQLFLAPNTQNNFVYGKSKAISTEQLVSGKHHFKPVTELIYAAKNQQIISVGKDQRINIYTEDGQFVRKLCSTKHPVSCIQLSHDEKIILVGEETTGIITFYSFESGEVISTKKVFDNSVFSADFIETQNSLLAITSGGSQHEIAIIHPLLGKQIKQLGGKGNSIKNLAWDNGKLYFSDNENSKILNDYFDFNEFRLGKNKGLTIDNKQLIGVQKNPYSLKLGKTKIQTTSKQGRILSWEISENQIFIGTDNYLLVYSKSGKLTQTIDAHLRGIRALCIGNFENQNHLFSSGEDEMVHLWPIDSNLISSTPKASFYLNFNREWILWTEKGYFASSSNGASLLGFVSKTALGEDKFSTMDEFFEVLYKPQIVKENIQTEKTLHTILAEKNQHEVDLSSIKGASFTVIDKFYSIDKNGDKDFLPFKNNGYSTDATTLYFDIKATDGGAGIKEINLLCNGKLVVTDDSIPHTKLNESFTRTYAVQLLPGTNKIETYAVNYQLRSSVKLGVDILFDGKVKANAKLYALVIGINEYKNQKNNLNYAYSDALSVEQKLNEISTGIFSSTEIITLVNKDATKNNIQQAFNTIAEKASPNDVFIFYFAGHGILISENDHSEYYLAPADLVQLYDTEEHLNTTAISTNSFKKSLSKIKAQKQLVLLDACHSGGAVEKLKTRGAAEEKSIFQLARSSGVVLIAASESKQYATEFEELGHGVFTYAFLQALSGSSDDINQDKKITVAELKAYMEDQVPELSAKYGSHKQYPTGFSTGQDFPIGVLK